MKTAKTSVFEGTFEDGYKIACDFYDIVGAYRFFFRVERSRKTKLLAVTKIDEQGE